MRLHLGQRRRRVHARPLTDPFDQALLDGLRQDIGESLDLCAVFVGDDRHLVTSLEDGPTPGGETIDFPRQLGLEVAHEVGELTCAVWDCEDMQMV